MKRIFTITSIILMLTLGTGFTIEYGDFDIESLYDYQKEYIADDVGVCALGNTKTYMDYRAVTNPTSTQYWYIKNNMEVDPKTGFLLDEEGFIGVALGSYYGKIGDRYYFTLDSGVILPVVKIDEKADKDTDSTGCYHTIDGSVIEFVIDRNIANEYYGHYGNGLVLQGNFSNYETFNGSIVKVEKVTEKKKDDYVTYIDMPTIVPNKNIFEYASGY